MWKFTVIVSLFLFIAIFSSIMACNKTSDESTQKKSNNIDQVISSLEKKYLVGSSVEGRVFFNKTREDGLLVAIQPKDSGVVSQVMIFSNEDSLHYDFPKTHVKNLGTSKIYLFKDGGTALIFSLEERIAYIFSLDNTLFQDRVSEICDKLEEINFSWKNYKGYELGFYHGRLDIGIATDTINNNDIFRLVHAHVAIPNQNRVAESNSEINSAACPPGYSAYRCDSGGLGSTSCSISPCSVSCTGGYNACCHLGLDTFCRCANSFVQGGRYGCFPD